MSWQQSAGERDDCYTDRHVDEEHEPPAEVRAAERDQRTADDRSERCAHADSRAENSECSPALVPAEQLLHEPGHLRIDQAARQTLDYPRHDEQRRVGREAGEQTRRGETSDADLEHE